MRRLLDNVDWKQVAALGALSFAVLILWDTRVLYPLKILVVFFHEMSHGLAAILTGGSVDSIEVVDRIGGRTWTRGGAMFWIASAGYLGSLLWGAAILMFSARTSWDRGGAIALGALLIGVSLWLVRPFGSFGFGFGVATGLALIASGVWLSVDVNELVLRAVGLTSCLYAVYDIKSDILDRPELRSDARILADHTGVPTLVWGVLWMLVALAAATFFLLLASKKKRQRPMPSNARM
jgi:hypothetical protein